MPAAKKPDLADAFVRGDAKKAVDTSIGIKVRTDKHIERKKVSFAMRPELHHSLKVAAAVHQLEMSEILDEALTRHLERLEEGAD